MPESISLNLNLDLSLLHSLRPCLRTRRVLARRGWAGKKVAILSILGEYSFVVPQQRAIGDLACQHSFSATC
jgi:hypothetical protein